MNNNLCYCLIHMVSSVFFHLVPSPLIVDLCPFLLFIRKKDISLTHHYQFKTVMLATPPKEEIKVFMSSMATAAAAKSLQSCPTLCNPIDGSPPGSTIPGILQARTLEWVAISFSNAWKWKVKVKSVMSDSLQPHGLQPANLLHPWEFPGKNTRVGCHCLLRNGH